MRLGHVLLLAGALVLTVLVAVPLFVIVPMVVGRVPGGTGLAAARSGGVDESKLPPLAQSMLPVVESVIARECPELNVLRVVAEVHAESGWRPQVWSNDSNGGAAGLLQINQANWIGLGGRPWASVPPPSDADIFDPSVHLQLGLKFLCGNLRAMTAHLQKTGKQIDPHDAMSVCHIAGCGRVLQSRTGVPTSGEAGCGEQCVGLIRRYLDNIRRYEREWSAPQSSPGVQGPVPGGGVDLTGLAAPAPYQGPATGCVVPDPTTSGCLTAATAHALGQLRQTFGSQIASVACWGARPETPTSDHPTGRACDVFPDRFGVFPAGERLLAGWRVAAWSRAYAGPLKIRYIIWQGRFWEPTSKDEGGWGERYNGAGVYDVSSPTGGHYDHLHISFAA